MLFDIQINKLLIDPLLKPETRMLRDYPVNQLMIEMIEPFELLQSGTTII